MPPKGSTTRGRGRGRARGRAGAGRPTQTPTPATSAPDSPNARAANDDNADPPTQNATPSQTAPKTTDVPSSTTLAAETDPLTESGTPAQFPSNDSPAGRPPPLSSSASSSPSVVPRGGPRKQLLAQPKFLGRRSKAEREALEATQSARRAEEAKAENDKANAAKRGTFGGRGRGNARGGYMGDTRSKERSAPIGPFSAGTASADVRRRPPGAPTGGSSGISAASRIGSGNIGGVGSSRAGGSGTGGGWSGGSSGGPRGSTSGGRSGPSKIKQEGVEPTPTGGFGGPVNDSASNSSDDSDEDEPAPRRNIDYIDLTSDNEASTAADAPRRAPVRVSRVEHRDRQQPVNAENSKQDAKKTIDKVDKSSDAIKRRTSSPNESRKGKQKSKDVEIVSEGHAFRGVFDSSESEDENGVEVKQEPHDTDGAQQMDGDGQPQSSAQKDAAALEKRKARQRPKKVIVPELQTAEERQEYDRHMLDLEILRQELGEIHMPSSSTAQDASGDTTMGDAPSTATDDKRADRVYLFQFPPVLPDLRPAPTVKKEPISPDLARQDKSIVTAAEPLDLDASAAGSNTAAAPIKLEDDASVPPATTTGYPSLASGAVGKLRIHASGRATLDWGGTALQMGMGTDVQFLQDVMVAKLFENETKEGDGESDGDGMGGARVGRIGGEAMALGQVRGKFVVTPDWEVIV